MVSQPSGLSAVSFAPGLHPTTTATNPSTSFNSIPTSATHPALTGVLHSYDLQNNNNNIYSPINQNPSSNSLMDPQYRPPGVGVGAFHPLPSSTTMISSPTTGLSSSERDSMYVPSEAPPAYELNRSEPSSSSSGSRSVRGRSLGRRRDTDMKSSVLEE